MINCIRLLSILLIFLSTQSFGQREIIYLNNPSFEDSPRQGGLQNFYGIRGWQDCGRIFFRSESPPDIHPVDFWEVTKLPSDGNTYLGMVVRWNESYEFVSQKLSSDLRGGRCYEFSIDLARSERYVSATSLDSDVLENFTEPAVLRIWGGNSGCNKMELLGESSPVNNNYWQQYNFKFEPRKDHRYIVLEAYYKTPVLIPYNGHILLDNASEIKEIECDEEIIAIEDIVQPEDKIVEPEPIVPPKPEEPAIVKPEPKKDVIEEVIPEEKKDRILQELDSENLREGQTIRIEKLYFAADTSSIGNESYDVLNEIYNFLRKNEKIIVEIGGHTNGLPKHDYCDRLSTARAKEVALYLVRKGIKASRIKYKGYGKRKPIASNHTKLGRQKNQRVEIKILSLDG